MRPVRVAGLALCGAGLLLRQPLLVRAALIGLGTAALTAPRQHETVGYEPLDTPKELAPGVWVVDSVLPGLVGKVLPVRMTVLRLPDGSLLLHSPTRYDPALHRALKQLGQIRHLVAPNLAHWVFLRDWQLACPAAVTWAAPGLRGRDQVRQAGVVLDHELTEAPAGWGGVIEVTMIPGGFGFNEAALFHRPSGTLVLTDTVLNLEPRKLPWLVRPVVRLFGSTAPDGMPPPYLRALIKVRRKAARQAAIRLLAFNPQRVLFAHGLPFLSDATPSLRRSFRWLLPA